MKHRHVRKFSKKLVFGLLCFALSAQLVFAARLPSPVAQAVGGQAPSASLTDLLRTVPGDMSENFSLVSVTVGKYIPPALTPAYLVARLKDNRGLVFSTSFASHLAQVFSALTSSSTSISPAPTSTSASQPSATSTPPLSFSYLPPAGTRTPSPAPQAYAVSPASLATLREDPLREIAQTRADIQAN